MNWFKTLKTDQCLISQAQYDSQIENHDQQSGDSFSTDALLPLRQSPNDLDFNGLTNQPVPVGMIPANNPLGNKLTPKSKGGKGIRKNRGNQIWRHPPHGAHINSPMNTEDNTAPTELESITEKLNSPPAPMFI